MFGYISALRNATAADTPNAGQHLFNHTFELTRRAQCCSSGKTPSALCQYSYLFARLLTSPLLSFFKTLVDHEVTVELKNDISIKGVLKSVDQFLNIKLDDIQVVEELKYPHLVSRTFFLRRLPTREKGPAECVWAEWRADHLVVYLVIRQERFHKGERRAICAFAWCGCRCGAVGGCNKERYVEFGYEGEEVPEADCFHGHLEAAAQASKPR